MNMSEDYLKHSQSDTEKHSAIASAVEYYEVQIYYKNVMAWFLPQTCLSLGLNCSIFELSASVLTQICYTHSTERLFITECAQQLKVHSRKSFSSDVMRQKNETIWRAGRKVCITGYIKVYIQRLSDLSILWIFFLHYVTSPSNFSGATAIKTLVLFIIHNKHWLVWPWHFLIPPHSTNHSNQPFSLPLCPSLSSSSSSSLFTN